MAAASQAPAYQHARYLGAAACLRLSWGARAEVGQGGLRQGLECRQGKERGPGNYCYTVSHVLSVLTVAGRVPNSCSWVSTLHLVPKMEVSDSCESRAKPQNGTIYSIYITEFPLLYFKMDL